MTLTASFGVAHGNTFPYIGRHQQLHAEASQIKSVLPVIAANTLITRTTGRTLDGLIWMGGGLDGWLDG